MKIILNKGRYSFKERDITYQVKEDLVFELEDSFYFISGNNGIGKTGFIELLLIPLLQKNKFNFAYLAQNQNNQQYTIQASLAFSNKFNKSKNLYINWFETVEHPQILIADEFDKYKATFHKILCTTVNCVFLVSHLTTKKDYPQFNNIKNVKISFGANEERIVTLENNDNV